MFTLSLISGIVEVPAIGLSIIILLKMGRRIPLCLTLVSAGIACFLTLIVPNGKQYYNLLFCHEYSFLNNSIKGVQQWRIQRVDLVGPGPLNFFHF